MAHIDAEHVGPGIDELADHFLEFRDRAERADEFVFAGHDQAGTGGTLRIRMKAVARADGWM